MKFLIMSLLLASFHSSLMHEIRTVRNSRDSNSQRKKTGTVHENNESIEEFIHENPLLSQLPMFSKRQPEEDRYSRNLPIRVFDKDRKSRAEYAENNFSNEYELLNKTLFSSAINKNVSEIILMPEMFSDESISSEETTTKEPFAVTGSLIDALNSISTSEGVLASSQVHKKTSTFLESPYYGVTTTETSISLPAGKLMENSQTRKQLRISQKMGLAESQFLGHNFMQLHPSNMNRPIHISERVDENEVKRSQTEGYLEVWGTKYYEDNRIDGDTHLRSDTVDDVSKNPFTIETEMMQVKSALEHINPSNPAAFGVKTFSNMNVNSPGTSVKKYPDNMNVKSESKILENDGKQVEERVSQIKDQKVTVTLSNPILFGHDYLMYPGAIIQPKVIVYKDEIKQTKNKGKQNKARAYGSLVANPYDFIDNSFSKNNNPHSFTTVSSIPNLKGVCGIGTAPLFVRSSHFEETVGSGRTVVIQSSEDDCVSACLTNKVDDNLPFDCVSASYRANTRDCQLTSETSRHLLRPRSGSIYYEKTCVDATVAEACSGATVIRKEQMVLVGFARDVFATESIEECISLCISSETSPSAGYRCLSFAYYYEKNLNCILNEASELTAPREMVKESMTEVDYFGVDHCYGIAYAADDKTVASTKIQNAHYVEDDIRVGEITAGSMVRPLRLS